MADGPLIRVEELRKSYVVGDVTVHALRGVTLEIARGSLWPWSGFPAAANRRS